MSHLTPVKTALTFLLQHSPTPVHTELVPLLQAIGRVLAEPPVSTVHVPGYDNSVMDGFVLHTDSSKQALAVSARIAAGSNPGPLVPGTAARIFTGAPIPKGANAVVMQEDTEIQGESVQIKASVRAGQHIRRQGEDIAKGAHILKQGQVLRAQDIGLAASVGVETLCAYRKLKVAIFFTGDELVEPGKPLPLGKLYNSNRYSIHTALQQLGCEVIDLGNVKDDLQTTKHTLQTAAAQADLVITTGGVSVGEEDHVREAVEATGSLHLWRLAMKPGKPLAFGEVAGTPFIGLPGNPVSALVTFVLFARPVIAKMQGRTKLLPAVQRVSAAFDWSKPGFRQEYLRVRLKEDGAHLFLHQGSGVLTSTSWADGLVVIPAEHTVQTGDMVDYISFTELFA